MDLRLDQLLNKCTVRLESQDKRRRGTGFFFAPGFVLTCAHVTGKTLGEVIEVFPEGKTSSIPAKVKLLFSDELDIAVLELDEKRVFHEDFSCVLLGSDIYPGDLCYSYGYPKQGFSEGEPVTLEYEGMTGGKIKHIKLKNGQIRTGHSGSPVLNLKTGKVCGIIKSTRAETFDLGGGAIPISYVFAENQVIEKANKIHHRQNSQWSSLLRFDVDAFDSDWSHLDKEAKKGEKSIEVFFFLLKAAFVWLLWGWKAPRTFPLKTIRLLIQHTFAGDLGQEIQRQRKELTRSLATEVDPERDDQTRLLYQLDAQAQVIQNLIGMLLDEEQDTASMSRLAWTTEVIKEQRDLIKTIQEKQGSYFPALEALKRNIKLFNGVENGNVNLEEVLEKLLNKHTNNNPLFLSFYNLFIEDTIKFSQSISINIALYYLINILPELYSKAHDIFPDSQNEAFPSLYLILKDLEDEIKRYPHFKVLRTLKLFLENIPLGIVQGGPFRAWNETGAYHFNKDCRQYPERASAEEMEQILCYDTHEEAAQHHRPCQKCMSLESKTKKSR